MYDKKEFKTKDGAPLGVIHKDLILDEPTPEIEQPIEAASQLEQVIEQQEQPTEQSEQSEQPVQEPVKESRSQSNFKALKSEAARLAKERDEAMALIRQYELEKQNRQVNPGNPAPRNEYQNNDSDIDNDSLVEGKHVNSLRNDIKAMRQELAESRKISQQQTIRSTLVSEHPDYDQVVNRENLKALELLKPHLARAIDLSDPYLAGKACYDLIKEFRIDHQESEKTDITRALIKQNLAKPKTGVAVVGTKNTNTSPMGRASEFYEGPLTDEVKKVFYQEMKDAMNNSRR